MEDLFRKIDDAETRAIRRIELLRPGCDDKDIICVIQDMTTAILRAIKQHKGTN
jgi:hypothetical protein